MVEVDDGQFQTISREVQATKESLVTSEVCEFGGVCFIPLYYLILESRPFGSCSHFSAIVATIGKVNSNGIFDRSLESSRL